MKPVHQYPDPLQPDTPITLAGLPGLAMALRNYLSRTMPASSVLRTYEERWLYISRDAMSNHEHALFARLVKDVGDGLFLGSRVPAWAPRKRGDRFMTHSRLTVAAIDEIITRGDAWPAENLRAVAWGHPEVRAKIRTVCDTRAHTASTGYDEWLAWLAANAGR